jgi:hypothetical protein
LGQVQVFGGDSKSADQVVTVAINSSVSVIKRPLNMHSGLFLVVYAKFELASNGLKVVWM